MSSLKQKNMEAEIKTLRRALCKIRTLEKKVVVLTEKNKEKSTELRKSKKRARYFELSRDNWKTKNKDKSVINKQLNKKLARLEKPKYHTYNFDIIKLGVQLRTIGRCSYESICRILLLLQISGYLRLGRLPCANILQIWVAKLGLYELNTGHKSLENKEVCLIIDESIKVGEEKMLLVLACPAFPKYESDKLPKKGISIEGKKDRKKLGNGLSFKDVKVVHIEGRKSWKGPAIKQVILNLKKTKGIDYSYILSDQGNNLRNAASLLGSLHVPDISHAVGTCLRHTYKDQTNYQGFIKLVGKYQSKCVNQSITYLRPPKQRSKARFMNQQAVVDWGVNLLNVYPKLPKKEQLFFAEVIDYKLIIDILDFCLQLAKQIVLPLKTLGLNKETLAYAYTNLELAKLVKIKKFALLKNKFLARLEQYLIQYNQIIKALNIPEGQAINVCSDVIESEFSFYKNIIASNPLVGVSLTALELPINGIKQEDFDEQLWEAVETISIADLNKWKSENATENQAGKRKEVLGKRGGR